MGASHSRASARRGTSAPGVPVRCASRGPPGARDRPGHPRRRLLGRLPLLLLANRALCPRREFRVRRTNARRSVRLSATFSRAPGTDCRSAGAGSGGSVYGDRPPLCCALSSLPGRARLAVLRRGSALAARARRRPIGEPLTHPRRRRRSGVVSSSTDPFLSASPSRCSSQRSSSSGRSSSGFCSCDAPRRRSCPLFSSSA